MDHKEYSETLDKGMAIAREHFAEIELAICKGKRLAIENFMDWLTVCVKTATKDLEKTGDARGVLDTTLASMNSMREVFKDKLSSNVRLVSKSVDEE